MNFRAACLALVLILSAVPSLAAQGEEVRVLVVVGKVSIPLGVSSSFREVTKALPKPGELPVEDAHERSHDAHTYCYRYRRNGREVVLEFFDSDFGLHTARLSTPMSPLAKTCTVLSSEPLFAINGVQVGLGAKALPALPGFRLLTKNGVLSLEREWTSKDRSEACFSRSVSIEGVPGKQGFSSIRVQNWEEPGC